MGFFSNASACLIQSLRHADSSQVDFVNKEVRVIACAHFSSQMYNCSMLFMYIELLHF